MKLPRATHFVVLNEPHLRRLLREYLLYYHGARTHLSLAKTLSRSQVVDLSAPSGHNRGS